MLDHYIQQNIVLKLKYADELSFTDLKPDDLDNKLFTYHLKIVIREGFVEKLNNGLYRLTPTGEKLWRRMSEKPETIALRPYSVLFMIIRSADHGWLLYRRSTHPVKDRVAFMHAIPNGALSATVHAHNEVLAKTGLDCGFRVIGSGFFHTYDGERLDGFTNFTLLLCEDPIGILDPNDDSAEYFWVPKPDFTAPEMLPNMKPLTEYYSMRKFPFFVEESVQL